MQNIRRVENEDAGRKARMTTSFHESAFVSSEKHSKLECHLGTLTLFDQMSYYEATLEAANLRKALPIVLPSQSPPPP